MVTWVKRYSSLLVAFALSASLVHSQTPTKKPDPSPAYDLQTESKMKGTVEDLQVVGDGKSKIAKLVFKDGGNIISVFLCPQAYLEDLGVTFAKGDSLEITGSKVQQNGADEVLARQILRGDDTVVLRDKKGKPVWN